MDMKAITYLYKKNSNTQTMIISSSEAATSILNDIIEARELNRKTLIIKLGNGIKMIDPTQIIDLTINDIDTNGVPV